MLGLVQRPHIADQLLYVGVLLLGFGERLSRFLFANTSER
jgi:hypothetical protein